MSWQRRSYTGYNNGSAYANNYDPEMEKAINASLHDGKPYTNSTDDDVQKAIAASLHDNPKTGGKTKQKSEMEQDPELAMALQASAEEEQNKCHGPNCDHNPNSRNIPQFPVELLNAPENKKPTLNDVVLLINSYHCKKQTTYRNIDLKKLSRVYESVNELNNEIIGLDQIKNEISSMIFYFCRTDMPKNQKDFLHMILSGPPGTGKTLISRIIGKILYKLDCIFYKKPEETDDDDSIYDPNKNKNINKSIHVNGNNNTNNLNGQQPPKPKVGAKAEYKFIEVKRQDLVGGYVGQTAIKTQKKIDEALGGVFFFDECYSLNNSNAEMYGECPYGKEAGDCINENMTNHAGEVVFIFAGYADQIDKRFLTLNAGLPSRIQFRFDIPAYKEDDLCNIFVSKVQKDKWRLAPELTADNKSMLMAFFYENYHHMKNYGRDVERLVLRSKKDRSDRTAFAKVGTDVTSLTLENIQSGLKNMLDTAVDKNKNKNNKNNNNNNDNDLCDDKC